MVKRRKLGTEIQRTRGSAVPLGAKPQTFDSKIAELCTNKSRCMMKQSRGCSPNCTIYKTLAKNVAEKPPESLKKL